MKRHIQLLDDESDFDMTPMLDVVFIMLIFFIVTSSFVKESGIDINRPEASTATMKEQGNIIVAISAEDNVWIDKRKIDIRAVRANIERLHAESPQGTVVVQADRNSRNGVLVKVLDQIKLAGVSNIALAAEAQ